MAKKKKRKTGKSSAKETAAPLAEQVKAPEEEKPEAPKAAKAQDLSKARSKSEKKSPAKTSPKDAKPSFGARISKWFTDIINELKRVIWPDKKKLKQSTLTVLLIIVFSVVVILIFDALVRFIFTSTGLYTPKETTPGTSVPAVSEQAEVPEPSVTLEDEASARVTKSSAE